MAHSKEPRFYVYAVTIGGRVKYIGKGTGSRLLTHLRGSHNPLLRNAVNDARAHRVPVRVRRIRSGLTEHEALKLERALIVRHHDRLLNVAYGNRSYWEVLLAKLEYDRSRLKPQDEVRREGAWNGLSVERRLEIGQIIEDGLDDMVREAKTALGLISLPTNSKA